MERQFEYRIKYKRTGDENTSYHYYMCESAEQALQFQLAITKNNTLNISIISIERSCPWSNKWIDESIILTDTKKI